MPAGTDAPDSSVPVHVKTWLPAEMLPSWRERTIRPEGSKIRREAVSAPAGTEKRRLAAGEKNDDLDIICPCDYRDSDLEDYGACYCALYVSKDIAEGKAEPEPLPDRRPTERDERPQFKGNEAGRVQSELTYPVWRCRVCGYLAAREEPPGVCPICKATKDRFERFM